jgi:hypothetical protein
MHNLGIYVFFLTFIVKVDTATDCHLSYEPIGHSGKLPSLDCVQPKTVTTSASNTTLMPSAPAVIEDDQDVDNTIPVKFACHWPKQLPLPPSPQYNLSLILPTSYLVSLKDLTWDELISQLYSVEFPESSSPLPDSSSHKTVTVYNTIDSSSNSEPLTLECMSMEDIMAHLYHPGSRPPPVRPCNTPNGSESKTSCTPEELHCLTSCRCFCNYYHIISTSKDGILLNLGEFPLALGAYATIPKAPQGKSIDCLPVKCLDIVHVDIAFGDWSPLVDLNMP